MYTEAGKNLPWNTVLATNDAHTELVAARDNRDSLQHLAGLGMSGVSIDSNAHSEAELNVQNAQQVFEGLLDITEILGVKYTDPNPTIKNETTTTEDLFKVISERQLIKVFANDPQAKPAITKKDFTEIAALMMGDDVKGHAMGALNSLFRRYPAELDQCILRLPMDEMPSHIIAAGVYVDQLPQFNTYVQENYSNLPNIGVKSVALIDAVTTLITSNRQRLLDDLKPTQ
jgi:hypothetical protein